MSKYNFTSYKNERRDSSKWHLMYEQNPNVATGVVPLSVADMEFETQPQLKKALINFVENANFGYYYPLDSYYEAVKSYFLFRHNIRIEKEDIITSAGVVSALNKAVLNLSAPGDEIIIFTPSYPPFYAAIEKNSRICSKCELINQNGKYSIDFDDFERKAKSATMLILCNPHNPIGRVWSRAELEKIADIAKLNDLLIISDDIHCDFVRAPFKHTFIIELSDDAAARTVTCTAPSKSFNLAAMQCSNIIIKNDKLKERFGAGVSLNPFGYIACETVYNECRDWLDECLTIIYKNAEYLENYFSKNLPKAIISPLEGTYLQWINLNYLELEPSELYALLRKQGLYLDDGSIFGAGGDGYVRLNLAVPQEIIKRACEAFSKADQAAHK